MTSPLIERIMSSGAATAEAEDMAVREVMQELILYGLSESGFFARAAFHGGTCLRIVHGLDRFSEDLDFSLNSPEPGFDWKLYAKVVGTVLEQHGLAATIDLGSGASALRRFDVRSAGPAPESLRFRHRKDRTLRVRVEVDTNPPAGALTRQSFLDFPIPHPLICYDLPSGMAGKCHAILCRDHLKGRDFFDFAWYVGRRIVPNLTLLRSLLDQAGPWRGRGVEPDARWLVEALSARMAHVDWDSARKDVTPFLGEAQRKAVSLWGGDYFGDRISKLERGLREGPG